jgi:hypothetical protein
LSTSHFLPVLLVLMIKLLSLHPTLGGGGKALVALLFHINFLMLDLGPLVKLTPNPLVPLVSVTVEGSL